ncbi:Sec-dependent nitrous-oxide reductase [Schinkia sp. CFF1]
MKFGKWYVPMVIGIIAGMVAGNVVIPGVSKDSPNPASPQISAAANKAFVPPGQHDEYYMFSSGGHSGQVFVIGVPSLRRIRTIPVFSPDSATGYGFDERTKAMMGDYSWGDAHHPSLSETNGDYDGRFLYINDNANNRAAMINLKTFHTEQILGPIPNIMGPHSAVFVTPNSEYFMMGTRFSVPMDGSYKELDKYSESYNGALQAISIDKKTGHMTPAWQLKLPPWNFDLSDAGKGPSNGWAFLTTYNTEEATHLLEVNASKNETDYIIAVNWKAAEQAMKEGKIEEVNGQKVIDPAKVPGIVYAIPAAKSPHGVDVSPDGKYFVANGKLSPIVTAYDFEKFKQAIEKKDFKGEVRGIPVLNYDSVKAAEIEVGLGPLHTQFGPNGEAYTTLFVESAVAKWKLGEWKVQDKVTVHYSPGHGSAAEGDTVSPDGKYFVALNKLAKDRHLPVGPSHPENMQLIDISGDKMEIINEAPIDPEPHYAQIVKADKINPIKVYPKDEKNPDAIWSEKDARVERNGNKVTVYGIAVRSRFYPDEIKVNEGDEVTIHLTNIDLDQDITHGFGINLYDVDFEVQPGQTSTIKFKADKPGVFPYYCTNFCSALHQEMQGYLLVKPKE